MITYEPFWDTLRHSDESTYTLIKNHHISSSTIDKLRKNKPLNTTTINDLCRILNCPYNPASHKRKDYLQQACDIVLESAAPETVCGVAQNIGREGENIRILPLKELRNEQVDMFSTVFIGNSQTRVVNGRMVTPRGYDHA